MKIIAAYLLIAKEAAQTLHNHFNETSVPYATLNVARQRMAMVKTMQEIRDLPTTWTPIPPQEYLQDVWL